MNINELRELAKQFGLPLIERQHTVTLIGEEQFIEFMTIGGDTMTQFIESPVGEIHFMAVAKPIKDKKTEKESYSIKLAFDVKKDAEFLAQISAINDAKVVTAQTYRGKSDDVKAVLSQGKAFIEARSKYPPVVFDKAGNETEAPMFFMESTGTAKMTVEPYVSEKGGTINLSSVKIYSLESPENSGGTVDRETKLAELRALAAKG